MNDDTDLHLRCPCSLFAGWVVSAALMLTAAPWAAMAQTSADAMATLSSNERGVAVKVTPKSIGSQDGPWEFAVVLDTHSSDLNDDLTQSASLTADNRRTFKPLSWIGAPAGGHQREGVLTFEVPAPRPTAIELRIFRPGESTPRIFMWQL